MMNIMHFYEAGKSRSGTALIPVTDTLLVQYLGFSTRYGNAVIKWGDGTETNFIPTKNSTSPTSVNKTYNTAYTGDVQVTFKQGLSDVYFLNLSAYTLSDNKQSKFNISDFGNFIKQFTNLYGYTLDLDYLLSPIRYSRVSGNLLDVPDSVESIYILRVQVSNNDLSINFNGLSPLSKLKSLTRAGGNVNSISVFGDISRLPIGCIFCNIQLAKGDSSINYTAGKVWASSFDTLSITLPLTTSELDNLLIDMDNSITTKIGAGVIYLGGYRSATSDAAVASLQAKGFTVNVARHNVFQRILDLPLQNSFVDSGEMGMTMVAGGTSNQPTFALSGRKAGEYCAVFNGSQSIKTTTNLPVNSDKVTIAFWMKTTQTAISTLLEMSPNYSATNAFAIFTNDTPVNRIGLADRNSGLNYGTSSVNINTGSWIHIVATIDRAQNGTEQNKIYVNGVLAYSQNGSYVTDNNGNFVNNILFIGQRAGSSSAFNGSLTKLKIYNYPLTAGEVSNLYNSEL